MQQTVCEIVQAGMEDFVSFEQTQETMLKD